MSDLPPEDMDMWGIFPLDSYPNDDSIYISPRLLTSSSVVTMTDILSNYAYAITIHDIAVAAAELGDLATISFLVKKREYLPIRWQMVYEKARDIDIREQLYLHSKYRPSTCNKVENPKLDDTNYIILLDRAIRTSNLAFMQEILSSYGNIDDLLSPYRDVDIPVETKRYLVEEGYIQVDDKIKCIIIDDPTCIDVLTPSEIEEVIQYDSISIFKSMVKETQSTHLVHGKILSYILATTNDMVLIRDLLPRSSYDDLKILIHRSITRHEIYIEIGVRGYFELLSDLSERETLLFVTSPLYEDMSEDTRRYMEYSYTLSFSDRDLLEGYIFNVNTAYIRDVITPSNRDMVISLAYQYHMWDPLTLAKILGLIK